MMLSEEDIENLKWVNYRIPDKEINTLVSFIEGYLLGKNDKKLINYISTYLNQEHHINIEYTTLIEQIDHYAYNQNKNLLDGFCSLLHEIYRYNGILKQDLTLDYKDKFEKIKEPISKKVSKEEDILKVGDFIKLGDIMQEDYKRTKFYDSSIRNPSWDLFYPSKSDFKCIAFYFQEDNEMKLTYFGKVRRLFSNSIVRINSLFIEDGQLIAYTDLFRIEVEKALELNEFEIVDSTKKPLDLYDLNENISNYTMGFLVGSLQKIINDWSFNSFSSFHKKWHNYNRDVNGNWYAVRG
ncbi:hypothetical protein [Aquimarina sp. 2304DJ70-9]|uniref:hypothetical protein n=1 Tax=Aquimarina penaris TaxID=3231044 RepID=UPI003461963E